MTDRRNKKRGATFSAPVSVPTSGAAELKQFTNGGGSHPNFAFTRYWWDGAGSRPGIKSWVEKKLRPGADPVFGAAAKSEVLLPSTAPADYADLDFLLDRFDRTLPAFERHAFIQVKITLDRHEAWHAGYERVRDYARSHFVAGGHPVILVAHVPNVAGLDGQGSHIHCIVLSRPVTINGLAGASHILCSDKGHLEAWGAWDAHLTTATGARS